MQKIEVRFNFFFIKSRIEKSEKLNSEIDKMLNGDFDSDDSDIELDENEWRNREV